MILHKTWEDSCWMCCAETRCSAPEPLLASAFCPLESRRCWRQNHRPRFARPCISLLLPWRGFCEVVCGCALLSVGGTCFFSRIWNRNIRRHSASQRVCMSPESFLGSLGGWTLFLSCLPRFSSWKERNVLLLDCEVNWGLCCALELGGVFSELTLGAFAQFAMQLMPSWLKGCLWNQICCSRHQERANNDSGSIFSCSSNL